MINSAPVFNELGHRLLVDERCGLFYARGVLRRGLVQTTRQLGALVVLL